MDTDSLLVKQILAGKPECFRDVVGKYKDAVFAVALSKIGNFADAEDIAQDVFVTAYQSLSELKNPSRLAHWLYAIASNKIKNYFRERNTHKRHHEQLRATLTDTYSPEEVIERKEAKDAVLAALRNLPDPNREAATLFYVNGYSQEDISRFTNRPVGTIKHRLHDARRQLRKELIDMVETELKRARPGKKFTDRIVKKIVQARVWISGGDRNFLLLADAKGKCFEYFLGRQEAEAAAAALAGKTHNEVPDIHSALVNTLEKFGHRIEQIALSASSPPNHKVRFTLRRDRQVKTVESEYSGRNAIQLAVHTKAKFVVEGELAEKWQAVKNEQGQPISSSEAWRSIKHRRGGVFRDIDEVLRELKRNPDSDRARQALTEAVPGHLKDDPWVQNREGGMERLRQWVKQSKGTDTEPLALAMLGGLYLFPMKDPRKAVRYLARAHRLRPKDEDIAFDLATAYTLMDKKDEAFDLLQKFKFPKAARCNNFEKLWEDSRFKQIAGDPDINQKNMFLARQVRTNIFAAKDKPKRRKSRCGGSAPVKVSDRIRNEVQNIIGAERLRAIKTLMLFNTGQGNQQSLLLNLTDGKVAVLPLPSWVDPRYQGLSELLNKGWYPWQGRGEGAFHVLADCGIELIAVVLKSVAGKNIAGEMILREQDTQKCLPIDALDSLSLALRGNAPVFLLPSLTERLYVRSESGRPLGLQGAIRMLRLDKGGKGHFTPN
jgi:RNA polymerase sigma-70 factor, ECF subfamily